MDGEEAQLRFHAHVKFNTGKTGDSFLTDDIIRMRYVEIDGQLRKVMFVVKMRGGNHSKDIREYVITEKGLVLIHPRRTDYYGLITGIPYRTGPRKAQETEAAPEPRATK